MIFWPRRYCTRIRRTAHLFNGNIKRVNDRRTTAECDLKLETIDTSKARRWRVEDQKSITALSPAAGASCEATSSYDQSCPTCGKSAVPRLIEDFYDAPIGRTISLPGHIVEHPRCPPSMDSPVDKFCVSKIHRKAKKNTT